MTSDNLFKQAIEIAEEEYSKAMDNPHIKNPAGYALYKAWRYADSKKGKQPISARISVE